MFSFIVKLWAQIKDSSSLMYKTKGSWSKNVSLYTSLYFPPFIWRYCHLFLNPSVTNRYIFSCCVIIWHVKKYSNDSATKLTHDKNFLLLPFVSEFIFPLFHRRKFIKTQMRFIIIGLLLYTSMLLIWNFSWSWIFTIFYGLKYHGERYTFV